MKVTEIQRFCMHDGPGIRTTVFLKGCPLHCQWCHNPETQSDKQELLFTPQKCIGCGACAAVCKNSAHQITDGKHILNRSRCKNCMKCTESCCSQALLPSFSEMTVDEIFAVVNQDRAFYGDCGGITLSGGEPLMQPEETFALLRICKQNGIKTAVETCGYFDSSLIPELVSLTDCFLWDFKDGNNQRHQQYTGVSHNLIKNNILRADTIGAPIILRCIMIKNVNMQEDHYRAIAELWHQLKNGVYVELLPYHAYGGSKMTALGGNDNGNPAWIPAENDLEKAKLSLESHGVKMKLE